MIVTIPCLGTLTEAEVDWLASEPLNVQALGTRCRFIVDGFERSEASRRRRRVVIRRGRHSDRDPLVCAPEVVDQVLIVARRCRSLGSGVAFGPWRTSPTRCPRRRTRQARLRSRCTSRWFVRLAHRPFERQRREPHHVDALALPHAVRAHRSLVLEPRSAGHRS
jgi:hypothetical protein